MVLVSLHLTPPAAASHVHWNLAMMISPCLGVPDCGGSPNQMFDDQPGDLSVDWKVG